MIFCIQNHQFCEFLTIFLIKMAKMAIFYGLKLLKIIKISKNILSVKVPEIEQPVALWANQISSTLQVHLLRLYIKDFHSALSERFIFWPLLSIVPTRDLANLLRFYSRFCHQRLGASITQFSHLGIFPDPIPRSHMHPTKL